MGEQATATRSASYAPDIVKILTGVQQSQATEAAAYRAMAAHIEDEANRQALLKIADEIDAQAQEWQTYTGKTAVADARRVRRYERMARVLGFTFAVKLMDRKKMKIANHRHKLEQALPQAAELATREEERDQKLFSLLNEKRLSYVGAMILGMNDAIVEITGTLAGLTLAMQNTRLIALSGLITGIAATLSMAASEFLAERTNGKADAGKSAVYTGVSYFATVVILLIPYLALDNSLYLLAMGIMLGLVVIVLAVFNYYTSVAQGTPFKRNFGQMCAISLGVAALSFALGLGVRVFLGVDV